MTETREPHVDTVVGVTSWEPRFAQGMKRTLEHYSTRHVLAYFIGEYGERTGKARGTLRKLVETCRDAALSERELRFGAPEQAWRALQEDLGPGGLVGRRVLLDITTMPREIIWSALYWLEAASADVSYVYNRPEQYAREWLARDPNNPRLVFRMAGTLEIERPTALLAVTGFDENRCRQAIEFYEPARVVLAAQAGQQHENDERNIGPRFSAGSTEVALATIDAFGKDHGYSVLREQVQELSEKHNVILCSFGPKPSAIALFRLQREFPQTALAYLGCKEYNSEYSSGLGEAVTGKIVWHGQRT